MISNFQTKKLKEIAIIFSGNSINEKTKADNYYGLSSGIDYISTKDLGFDSTINYENGVKIPFEELNKFKLAPKDTVFICAEGGSAGRKIAMSDRELCFVNKLFAIVSNEKVLPKYIFYALKSENFTKQFKDSMTGIIGGVSLSKFKELQIVVPSLVTQEKIVAKLDAIFEKIDVGIESLEENLKNVDALYQAQLESIFQAIFLSSDMRLLGDVTKKIADGVHKKPSYTATGVPFLKINNLTEGNGISFKDVSFISQEDHEEFKRRTNPEKGDILITKDGTIGVVRVIETDVEFSIFVSLALIKPKEIIDSYYLNFLLKSPQIQKCLIPQGAALKHIYLTDLRNLSVPVPDLSMQYKLSKKLMEFSEKIDRLKADLKEKMIQFQYLQNSVLRQAFSGELVKE